MSIKEYLQAASVMIVGFAVVGVFLGLTVIMVLVEPGSDLTANLIDTLKTLALPMALGAILTAAKGQGQ